MVASQTRCQQRRIRRTTAMADAVWRMDQVEESAWKHRLCELGRTPPGTPKALTTPWFSISYSYFGAIGVCLVVVVSCTEFTMHIHIHMLMHMIAELTFLTYLSLTLLPISDTASRHSFHLGHMSCGGMHASNHTSQRIRNNHIKLFEKATCKITSHQGG